MCRMTKPERFDGRKKPSHSVLQYDLYRRRADRRPEHEGNKAQRRAQHRRLRRRAGKRAQMMKAGRINFMAKADYTKDSELMRIVKRIVDMLAAENDLMELSLSQYDKSKENY